MNQPLHLFENVVFKGPEPSKASKAIICIHGRGDASDGMQELARQLIKDDSVAMAFPKATNATWYPASFLQPWDVNQPWLDSALNLVHDVVTHFNDNGIPTSKIYLLGFSQGACLSLEYASRHAQKYGGLIVLSGGLIGPHIERSNYNGNFQGTEILMGCSDVDFHIPVERIHDSETMVTELGATVDKRIYPGMGHFVNEDELAAAAALINKD
ncbi:MAG: dienelactone hydrolase family protein [Bacteroidetes bacterium]|nr:dienelactone hydrolase family protein [Bacteroidota bacterium]MCH8523956.1 dienelactone hydrolase family protein [Balneolales bacterium]